MPKSLRQYAGGNISPKKMKCFLKTYHSITNILWKNHVSNVFFFVPQKLFIKGAPQGNGNNSREYLQKNASTERKSQNTVFSTFKRKDQKPKMILTKRKHQAKEKEKMPPYSSRKICVTIKSRTQTLSENNSSQKNIPLYVKASRKKHTAPK